MNWKKLNKKQKNADTTDKGVNVMKRSAVFGILFMMLLSIFVFFGAFTVTYLEMKDNIAQREEELPAVEAVHQDIVTSNETEYVMEIYDTQTNTVKEESSGIPVQYIGCTREEIVAQLEEYEQNPSIEDLEAGFVDYSLVYFSADKIILRKNFNSAKAGYKYCIVSEKGYLETSSLPNHVQLQVIQGMYLKDLPEVFSFLETYSS